MLYQVMRITVTTLLLFFSLSGLRFACASPCESPVSVEADQKESVDGAEYFKGNVEITAGSLIIQGAELSVREEAGVFYIKKAKFTLSADKREIHGHSDELIFYESQCILDLIGDSRIVTDGNVKEYNTVRYFLDENKVDPLWYHIDQGVRIRP